MELNIPLFISLLSVKWTHPLYKSALESRFVVRTGGEKLAMRKG